MLTVPLLLGGTSAALLVAGKVIALVVLTALILFVGIAVSPSIILLGFTLEAQHVSTDRSVVDAVAVRFRSILMTSFSTIIGVLPLALGRGPRGQALLTYGGGNRRRTHDLVLLALVVVPVVSAVGDDVTRPVEIILA